MEPTAERMKNMVLKAMVGMVAAYLKEMREERKTEIEADQEHTQEMLSRMDAETKAMRDKRMKSNLNAWREETVACQETAEARLECKKPNPEETESNPVKVKSVAVHEEFRTEDAAAKPSGTMKKRHRGRHLAVGRLGKQKDLPRGDCGTRRKLAATCRKMPRCAAVAWRKGNVFRKIRTQGNCRPRNELAPAGIRMTHIAKVARRKEHGLQRQGKDDVAPRTPKGRKFSRFSHKVHS
jgi:hypothetical protein